MEERVETPQGRFSIRRFVPGDEEKVLRLWATVFEKTMPLTLWRWKYSDNPFGASMMVCASEGGEIAAFFAGLRYPALWKGREVFLLHAVDNMSNPKYRGVLSGKKGLFARTAAHCFRCETGRDKSVFVYGYPGKRHFRLGQHLLGYMMLPRGMVFLRANVTKVRAKSGPSLRIVERIAEASEDLDRLCQAAAREYPFTVRRDAQFLTWRFMSHPLQEYQLWICRSYWTKRFGAFAAVQKEGNRGRLVDLLGIGDERDAIRLVVALASELGRSGVETLECWLPQGHFLTTLLKAIGFEEAPEPFGFVPACLDRSFHPDLDITWAARHFFYTLADGDLL